MTAEGLNRFYKTVSVQNEGDGFAVFLDSRVLKTPAGKPLILPSRILANSLAREWEAQGERIRPERMPLTRLVISALERTAIRPEPLVEALAAYGETDLICHWADYPEELIVRQRTAWQPLLDWATDILHVRLEPMAGIRPREQDQASLDVLRRHLEALDPFSLTAAEAAASVTGSVILTLSLAYGRLDAQEAWRISRIDEDFQIEKWGEDAEALHQAQARRVVLDAAAVVFASLRPKPAA